MFPGIPWNYRTIKHSLNSDNKLILLFVSIYIFIYLYSLSKGDCCSRNNANCALFAVPEILADAVALGTARASVTTTLQTLLHDAPPTNADVR